MDATNSTTAWPDSGPPYLPDTRSGRHPSENSSSMPQPTITKNEQLSVLQDPSSDFQFTRVVKRNDKGCDVYLRRNANGVTAFIPTRSNRNPTIAGFTVIPEQIKEFDGYRIVHYRKDHENISPQGFRHPGVLLDLPTLKEAANLLAEGDPIKTEALEYAKKSEPGNKNYQPSPVSTVNCGEKNKDSLGCEQEVKDAQAAYTQALLWYYTKDPEYANNSARIMNAWAEKLTGGHTGTNAALQAAWSAQLWTRAAEIIRHTSDAWNPGDAAKFEKFLLEQYLPDIQKITPNHYGNWHASTIEARTNIGVFTDRMDIYKGAIEDWRSRVPAFIYDESDGPIPKRAPGFRGDDNNLKKYWQNITSYENGVTQETARDREHTAYALAAFINTAETARIQNIPGYKGLYEQHEGRLVNAMEFQSQYAFAKRDDFPPWLTSNRSQTPERGTLAGTFEIGYRHYDQKGRQLPKTAGFLQQTREKNAGARGYFHYLWERLTHGIPRLQAQQ